MMSVRSLRLESDRGNRSAWLSRHVASSTTSAPLTGRFSLDRAPSQLDDARILPRFRERARLVAGQREALQQAAEAAREEERETRLARTFVPEPGDLRGIPVVGRGVGGVSPGTQPETHATTGRVGDWSPREREAA